MIKKKETANASSSTEVDVITVPPDQANALNSDLRGLVFWFLVFWFLFCFALLYFVFDLSTDICLPLSPVFWD